MGLRDISPFSPFSMGPEESGTDEARAEGQAADEKKEPKVQRRDLGLDEAGYSIVG